MSEHLDDQLEAQLPADKFRAWTKRPYIRHVFLIWLGLTILFEIFGPVQAHLMGAPASEAMKAIEDTMSLFTYTAAPVAALVISVVLYSIFGWRQPKGAGPSNESPAIKTNGPVTTAWVVISSLLCVFLLIWGLGEMNSLAPRNNGVKPLVIDAIGNQWVWTFKYPDNGNIESNQLYMPKDQPVVFHVSSVDVVHSLWIVQLGVKIDANPERVTLAHVTPTVIGRFDVRCAELCGLYHAHMQTNAVVVSPDDFNTWVANGGHA
ncbi:MAG TPA: cytochrome c oxidase subunit II [Candidatus Nanopelagicaceae bacterium]|nr:cytochrome c oxidase subunit II [Candidatus Nanopelagicaceae bacterium]